MVKINITSNTASPVTIHVTKDPSLKEKDFLIIDGVNYVVLKVLTREIVMHHGIPTLKPKEYDVTLL
jgi:hypothetical protein